MEIWMFFSLEQLLAMITFVNWDKNDTKYWVCFLKEAEKKTKLFKTVMLCKTQSFER